MYCPKCGTEIPDASTFCLKCGNKVIDPEQILRSYKTSNILFISTIVVVILGIGVLYLLLRNHDSDDVKLAANRPSPKDGRCTILRINDPATGGVLQHAVP